MGSTYTRQSTFTDGDTITADLFNTEFDQLVAAFAATSGHSHDGTAGEGGAIGGLITPGITLGDNTIDVTLTFDGGSNDGVLKWMEDEDYFEFSDDILIASTEKLQFRDTAIYINSSADGQLDLVADTEIQIAATTIDINGAADISGNLAVGGNLTVTGTTTFNGGTITLGDAAADNVVFGADVDSSIIPDDDDTYDLGSSSQQWRNLFIDGTAEIDTLAINGTTVTATAAELNILDGVTSTAAELNILDGVTSTAAELNILDGVTSTATELNILDGDTSATSTTVADADRVVFNDAGTMKQVAVTDLAAYFDDEITAMPNLVTTAATTVGALNSGSITSGFGTIDTGSSTITTTGLISGGSLDIDNVLINGTTIGHTDDTDLITLANGVVTVAGEVSVTTLDIGGTNVTSTAAELNILDGVTSTAAELNILDGVTSTAAELNILDGVTATAAELNILDGVTSTAAELNILDGVTSTAAELNALDGITATAAELNILDVSNSTLGDLSEISTVANDDVFLAIDTSGGGLKRITRSTVVSGLATSSGLSNVVEDTTPQLGGNLDTNSHNILIDDAHFIGDENGNEQIVFQTTSSAVNQIEVTNAASGSGVQIASTGGDTNIDLKLLPKGSGQVVIDGNVGIESGLIDLKNAGAVSKIKFYCESSNAHAQTLQGAPHSEAASNSLTLPSTGGDVDLVSTASTATLTNKTLTSPKINEDVAVTSTATELNVLDGITAVVGELNALDLGSTAVGTAIASKAMVLDSNKDYTGVRNFTLSGELDAGSLDISGNADIDGTLETDALSINGTTVTSTAAELNILDGVTSTAAELNTLDGITAVVGELNALDLGSTAVGTAIASKAMILDSNKDYTGVRNFTLSGELDAGSLDVSGNVDVDGTLETDALSINGTTVTSTAAELNILDGVTSTAAELNILDGVTSTAAELNILDGVTTTAAEINLIDGGTARGTTAVADGDGVLINDAGTMRMTSVDTLSTYMSGKSVGGSNIVTTGALNSGSITSGFGTINTGSSAITTTGLISGGSLDIDNVLINGTTIGHTDDTDLITVADGLVTVAGEVSMTTLDIGGTNVTSTAAELNILDGVTATAAEINALDGITAVVGELNALDIGSTAVGTAVASKAMILDSNKDYTGVRNFTLSGELDAGSLDISGNADIDGTLETDALSINGTTVTSTAAELNILDGVTSNATELNVLDALDRGSLIYGNSSGATAVLGQGSANQVLTSDGTDISWADAAGGPSYTRSASAPGSPSAGDWWYNTGYGVLYIYDGTDGWITNSDRGFGSGILIAASTFSLILMNNGDVFTARFETEAQITADIGSDVATHSYQPVDSDGTSAISSNTSGMQACSNTTRGVINMSKATNNGYVYLTLATRGSATTFGNAVETLLLGSACDHATRGVFAKGSTSDNALEYITIASTGNATDFGNLTAARRDFGDNAVANTTRGVFCGGVGSGSNYVDIMDYITIASAGNATDFGNLTSTDANSATACSIVRGIIFAGANRTTVIDYITIASAGNATDFGDHLTNNNTAYGYAIHNKIYAYYNRVDGAATYQEKHTIATAANATQFTWTKLGNIGTAGQTCVIKGWIAASG